ncbi:MAG: outer membrane protein assembly factor BamE [Succinatimonas hippei]|nr:outer membrane protein assembly factor BamE [Succinatimonas hippei]
MRKNKLIVAGALAFLLSCSGCAYRADLAQGNFVEQSQVNKLHAGMTPEQVRFVMGTPMLIDPFDSTRWYYVHYLREGWSDPKIENLVLLFQNGVLVDMQGDFKRPASFAIPLSN